MIDPAPLRNRVLKNQRHLAKWARREGIEAFRLYDRDMPEFPMAIDRYRDWLHVQVFEKKRTFSDQESSSSTGVASAAPASTKNSIRPRRRSPSKSVACALR